MEYITKNRVIIMLFIAVILEIAAVSINKWLKIQTLSQADQQTFKICMAISIACLAALILMKIFVKNINKYVIYVLMLISIISALIITVKLNTGTNKISIKSDSYALNISGYFATFGALLLFAFDKQKF